MERHRGTARHVGMAGCRQRRHGAEVEVRMSGDLAGGAPEAGGGAARLRRWLTAPAVGLGPENWVFGVRRWRRTAGIFLVYLAYAVVDMLRRDNVPTIVLGFALLGAFVWLYLGLMPRAAFGGEGRYRVPVLIGMLACLVIYLPAVGGAGVVMTVYLAVALVMLLRPILSIPLVLALAAADTWLPQYVRSWDAHGEQWSVSAPVLLAAITLYWVRGSLRTQMELHRAHREIERLAKEQERLRIARDLHDLLGHALTTITVKAELSSKLVGRDPARAAAEMAEVAALGRQGLADVRAAVAGYREVSLVTELAAARQVLGAAGIRAELPAAVEDVPGELRELFGWVLREGVTNAVRHSDARHVRVTVDGHSIEVVDDGVGPHSSAGGDADPGSPRSGSGLAGLAERVAARGGRVETGPAPRPAEPAAASGTTADKAPASGTTGQAAASGTPGGASGTAGEGAELDGTAAGHRSGFRLRVVVPTGATTGATA
jgi:two-component system sensor histidine kinase DesK